MESISPKRYKVSDVAKLTPGVVRMLFLIKGSHSLYHFPDVVRFSHSRGRFFHKVFPPCQRRFGTLGLTWRILKTFLLELFPQQEE
jgi:hypothetical protein